VQAGRQRPALHLHVREAWEGEALFSHPESSHAAVELWRDARGDVCAFAYETDGEFYMDWPAVARFRFSRSGDVVSATPVKGVPVSTLERVWRRGVVPAALQCLGYQVLHASAVALPDGIVGFFGDAEAGKSTFAFAASQRGYVHWADDTVVLEARPDHPVALPIPFDAALRPASARHLVGLPSGTHQGTVTQAPGGPVPVRALVQLQRRTSGFGRPVLRRVSEVDAFRRLLANACTFSMQLPGASLRVSDDYLTFANAIPVFELEYTSGFDRLDDALDVVLDTLVGPLVSETSR
jgi:hypothetical protein